MKKENQILIIFLGITVVLLVYFAFALETNKGLIYGLNATEVFISGDLIATGTNAVTVNCDAILENYENETEELFDFTGVTIWVVSYCYDWKNGKLNETYEDEKWKELNSYWVLNNKTFGNRKVQEK